MINPKTILEISDLPKPVICWENAALILIDFQNEYVHGKLHLGQGALDALENANLLLQHARRISAPVFHVIHHGSATGALFNPTEIGAEILSGITVLDNEAVVVKGLPNAFANTNLRQLIDSTGRNTLVVAGLMSHMCVSSTVRSSIEHGFTSFVCHDACYSRALRGVDGDTLPSKTVHQVSMAALQDRFATVCSASELISA